MVQIQNYPGRKRYKKIPAPENVIRQKAKVCVAHTAYIQNRSSVNRRASTIDPIWDREKP